MVALPRLANDPVREAARLLREGEDQFLLGNPHRAIELLKEVAAICEECGLRQYRPCVAAHVTLYRIYRAMRNHGEAARHFEKAVNLGANASLLRLN